MATTNIDGSTQTTNDSSNSGATSQSPSANRIKVKAKSILSGATDTIRQALQDYQTQSQSQSNNAADGDGSQTENSGFPGTEAFEKRFPAAFGYAPQWRPSQMNMIGTASLTPGLDRASQFDLGSSFLGNSDIRDQARQRARDASSLAGNETSPITRNISLFKRRRGR